MKKKPYQVSCQKCKGNAYFSGGCSGKYIDYVCNKCNELITVDISDRKELDK